VLGHRHAKAAARPYASRRSRIAVFCTALPASSIDAEAESFMRTPKVDAI
jgi:hypothetical protein